MLIPTFFFPPWRLPAFAAAAVRLRNTVSDISSQNTVTASAILRPICWAGQLFVSRSSSRDGVRAIVADISVLPSGTPSTFSRPIRPCLSSLCVNSYLFFPSVAAASLCCCRGTPPKYRVWYIQSKHRHRFCYLASNMLGKTIICQPLLLERWSWSHRSRHFRSAEWDAVNVFSSNTSVLVPPRLYRHHTHYHMSLLLSASVDLTTIRFFFVVPIVPPLCRISDHIFRVSVHCCPPRLCLPRTTVSFVPIIYSLTIVRTFQFSWAGTPSPISAIPFLLISLCADYLLLLSVANASRFFLQCNYMSVPPGWNTISDPP